MGLIVNWFFNHLVDIGLVVLVIYALIVWGYPAYKRFKRRSNRLAESKTNESYKTELPVKAELFNTELNTTGKK